MIIFTHHTGEPYGILGAQVAATFFQRRLSIPSIVVGIERGFSKERLLRFIDDYDSEGKEFVAFTHLCGRKDLIELIGELKGKGFITILAGPQASQDYHGEPDIDFYPRRFKGMKSMIDLAFHGPVDGLKPEHLRMKDILLKYPWNKDIFLEVDWSNIYTFSDTLKKLDIRLGQVLNAVGCPYASKTQAISLPPPPDLAERGAPDIEVQSAGCIFCDVSRDKGFHGSVDSDVVIAQIAQLPESD